jgi:hypothetical protein
MNHFCRFCNGDDRTVYRTASDKTMIVADVFMGKHATQTVKGYSHSRPDGCDSLVSVIDWVSVAVFATKFVLTCIT